MGLNPLNNKSDFDKYIMVDKNRALPTQVNMVQRYHWWYQAMKIYSHQNFTFESDRLIALAGLASKFQWPGDEFLYGLWRSDLVHGLAWRVGGREKGTLRAPAQNRQCRRGLGHLALETLSDTLTAIRLLGMRRASMNP